MDEKVPWATSLQYTKQMQEERLEHADLVFVENVYDEH